MLVNSRTASFDKDGWNARLILIFGLIMLGCVGWLVYLTWGGTVLATYLAILVWVGIMGVYAVSEGDIDVFTLMFGWVALMFAVLPITPQNGNVLLVMVAILSFHSLVATLIYRYARM